MSIMSHIVVFVVGWWLIFFLVLPWGVHSIHESEEGHEEGLEIGAPQNPHIKLKALITTGLAFVLWLIFWLVMKYELISIG